MSWKSQDDRKFTSKVENVKDVNIMLLMSLEQQKKSKMQEGLASCLNRNIQGSIPTLFLFLCEMQMF